MAKKRNGLKKSFDQKFFREEMQDISSGGMAGSWRLSKLGSDYLPGIDKLQGCPMVLKMKGESANTSEVAYT